MSITYPLELPSAPGIRGIRITKSSVVAVPVSPYTGNQQVQVYPGQWWEASVSLPVVRQNKSAEWEAFFGSLNGKQGTFLLGDPYREVPNGQARITPGIPVVDGAHGNRFQEIDITDCEPSVENYLLYGDYLSIGEGLNMRLHQVLKTVNTNEDGKATLTLWPRTRTALAGGESITLVNPKGLFRLSTNKSDISREPGGLTSIDFTAVEAL